MDLIINSDYGEKICLRHRKSKNKAKLCYANRTIATAKDIMTTIQLEYRNN